MACSESMAAASWVCGFVVVIAVGTAGCASQPATRTDAPPKPAAQGSGHWVSLPPETGSYVPRRVWVDDRSGVTNADSSVRTYSPSEFERIQRNSLQTPTGGGR